MHEHMYKLHRHSILSFSTEVNVFPNDLMRQMPPNPLGLKIGEAVATCQRMVIKGPNGEFWPVNVFLLHFFGSPKK